MTEVYTVKSISEAHRLLGVSEPLHPLISVLRHMPNMNLDIQDYKVAFDMYIISLKSDIEGSITYGRNSYDFEEGTLIYMSPGQVVSVTDKPVIDIKGWTLFIHPDLIRTSNLGASMNQYSFFDYGINEALHISEKERAVLTQVVNKIEMELEQNMDRHSQELIVHHLEAILKYSSRFYDRQFFTRTNSNKDFVTRFEQYLKEYFGSNQITEKGIPSVSECGKALNMSGHYLSDMLKVETGKSAKEHIHLQLVEKAKNRLLNSQESISEVAYDLGFEYPQHFSKLFKAKVGMSPSEFRKPS